MLGQTLSVRPQHSTHSRKKHVKKFEKVQPNVCNPASTRTERNVIREVERTELDDLGRKDRRHEYYSTYQILKGTDRANKC